MSAGLDLVEVPRGAASTPSVVYFFGDSITLGWRDEDQGGWPVRLLRNLHRRGHSVTGYNLGIRGDTSGRIADRWEDEVKRRRRDGEALLVFAFGVNDATLEAGGRRSLPLDQTVRNLRQIIRHARPHPLLIVGPAPIDEALMHQRLNAMGKTAMPTPASIAETAAAMAVEAEGASVPFVDLLGVLDENATWRSSLRQTDGLHPSSSGHDLIASEVERSTAWQRLFPALP